MISKLWITFCLTWLVLRVASGIEGLNGDAKQRISESSRSSYSLPSTERS